MSANFETRFLLFSKQVTIIIKDKMNLAKVLKPPCKTFLRVVICTLLNLLESESQKYNLIENATI